MGAGHHHGHQHPGAVGPDAHANKRRLSWAFGVTAAIVVIQLVGALLTGSLALLTDTVHAITDSTGLLVALIASSLVLRPATDKRTWGFRRVEVLAALGQAVLLLAVGVYAAIEGVRRLWTPPDVPGTELLVFGVLGLAANVAAMAILASSRSANFNMRAAFLEVLNDALGSLGVIVAAIVILTTGFQQADALAGLLIAALIVPRAVVIMRETVAVLMEFTPSNLDLDAVRQHILALDHVKDVHDLHASTVATGLPTLSAHVVVKDECFHDGHAPDVLLDIRDCVAQHFEVSVEHTTFQLETERFRALEPNCSAHA
ncbi:cation diffusion facilitator family transporter [Zhihengliuella alba]|uniref:Cation diffusion facilitator family transporter n=1 Tax=Zhihengliuella alba TaxID=547018 RepID=A0ABP7DWE4_9MICC